MDKIKFAELISYIAMLIQRGETLSIHEIEEIDRATQPEPAKVDFKYVDALMAAMVAGNNKIEAIKVYRNLTDASLLDSKNAVEKYWVKKPETKPETDEIF